MFGFSWIFAFVIDLDGKIIAAVFFGRFECCETR